MDGTPPKSVEVGNTAIPKQLLAEGLNGNYWKMTPASGERLKKKKATTSDDSSDPDWSHTTKRRTRQSFKKAMPPRSGHRQMASSQSSSSSSSSDEKEDDVEENNNLEEVTVALQNPDEEKSDSENVNKESDESFDSSLDDILANCSSYFNEHTFVTLLNKLDE